MSFTIGDITFTPRTASEHANDLLTEYNALLQAQGLDKIVATQDNALWLMMLATGSKFQATDEIVVQGFNSFNVDLADAAQISNILPAAGTELTPGAYTTALLTVAATPGGTLTVPQGAMLPLGAVNFTTASGISVPASGIGYVEAICDTIGPIAVGPDQLTAFSTSFANFLSVTNASAGIPGRNPETQNEARQRLIIGDVVTWNVDGVQRAIGSLTGVSACKVYFNYDPLLNMVLEGGYEVLPRHAYIVIAGADTNLEMASTYAELMSAPTQGTRSEDYEYLSGQVIQVSYDFAGQQNLYVKVYYDGDKPTQDGFDSLVTQIVEGISFSVGQTVSANTILGALQNFTYASLIGADVSLDGVTWSDKAVFNATNIPVVFSVAVASG